MGTPRNSYDYSAHGLIAKQDYRCAACGGWIFKGEHYESKWHGREHMDCCPTDPAERTRRQCMNND